MRWQNVFSHSFLLILLLANGVAADPKRNGGNGAKFNPAFRRIPSQANDQNN